MNEQIPSQENLKLTPLPRYRPEDQIGIDPQGAEQGSYGDPILYAISIERTRALRTMDPEGRGIRQSLGGDGLRWAMEAVDRKVGEAFQAHGIAKGDPLVVLDAILTKGIDPKRVFYTISFSPQPQAGAAIGAENAFTSGGLVLVSEYGQPLAQKIKFVILGEEYSRVVDLFRAKYPEVAFVTWHDAPAVLTDAYNQATGEQIQKPEINEANWPTYQPARKIGQGTGKSVDIPGESSEGSGDIPTVW